MAQLQSRRKSVSVLLCRYQTLGSGGVSPRTAVDITEAGRVGTDGDMPVCAPRVLLLLHLLFSFWFRGGKKTRWGEPGLLAVGGEVGALGGSAGFAEDECGATMLQIVVCVIQPVLFSRRRGVTSHASIYYCKERWFRLGNFHSENTPRGEVAQSEENVRERHMHACVCGGTREYYTDSRLSCSLVSLGVCFVLRLALSASAWPVFHINICIRARRFGFERRDQPGRGRPTRAQRIVQKSQ